MGLRRPVALAAFGCVVWASPSLAETDPAHPTRDETPLTSTYDAAFLRDLPTSDSLFVVMETMQPSIVSDRFSAGGLYSGRAARLGGFLSSWTQTVFRVDGVSITDPGGSGMPLLFPTLGLWQQVQARTGAAGAERPGTGLEIDLRPLAPADRWVRAFEAATSHVGMQGRAPSTDAPAIARLDGWDRATLMAGGPILGDRLGAVFAASWTRGSQFQRAQRFAVEGNLASAFSHVVLTPNDRDRIRLIGWLQHNTYPFELGAPFNQPLSSSTDRSGHAQAVWEREGIHSPLWRASASYTARRRIHDVDARSGAMFERLVDGPVGQLSSFARGTVQQWTLAARAGSIARGTGTRRHGFHAGIDATGGHSEASTMPVGLVAESIHGLPARVWKFSSAGISSRRQSVTIAPYLADRFSVSERIGLDAGMRFESASGSAAGGATDIGWRALLPRARVRWALTDRRRLVAFAGYARSMRRLALDDLAVGDPGAPTADVFRVNPPGTSVLLPAAGPLVSRAGPGTGGNPEFSAIDPGLKPPMLDELVAGAEARPWPTVLLRVTAVARRERDLLGLMNVGAPASTSYSSFTVQDPGGDVLSSADDQLLSIYDRRSSTFGRDRYLLTNPGQEDKATFEGVELTIQIKTERLMMMGGATAGQAKGPAASRGFGPLENDHTVVGELFTDPNAGTLARGRLFADRAYTAKFAAVYKLPADVRLGVIARYQDGQAFARVLVFPALNQGTDAVRAFSNGESRFMFIGTLDARLQKRVSVGGRRVDLFLDGYNLLNLSNSVEEDVAAPPDVRIATAVQPPRSFHAGLTVNF
jgi:TonB-dependent receptor-like protein